jgi:hypothetical protein
MVTQNINNIFGHINFYFFNVFLFIFLAIGIPTPGFALLPQTGRDFDQLRDILREYLEANDDLRSRVTPTLLATPIHHWYESRQDFASQATALVKSILKEPNDVILCGDCNLWRVNVATGERLHVQNGEIGLGELGILKSQQKYGQAKSLTMIRETPSGIELKVIELDDGRILLSALADGNSDLDTQKPWLRYTKERSRRLRGEGLTYGLLNIGLYPKPIVQLEFIEQWGAQNQHLSGVGISLINPMAALGAVYHYLWHSNKKIHFSGALYMPLAQAIVPDQDQGPVGRFVLQGMAQYNFSKSHALGLSVSTQGIVSLGIVFQDILLMPVIL